MIRRTFIKKTGFLSIGFCFGKPLIAAATTSTMVANTIAEELPASLSRQPSIDAWLRITTGGRLQVFTGKMELGQGIRTAIAQVAAEELEMPMDKVDVTLAETGVTPDEGYTAGSGSIDNSAMSVRYAAAAAREKLFAMAAAALQVPAGGLSMKNGLITDAKTNREISFTKLLAGKQITDKVTLPVKLKPREQYRLVGKPIFRDDIRNMVEAKPVFLQDLRMTGMLHARIIRPPAYDCRLIKFDEAALLRQFPAVVKVVVDGSFIGIITRDEYTAVRVQQTGSSFCKWETKTTLLPSQQQPMREYLRSLPSKSQNVKKEGSVSFPETMDENVHSASYYKPYMMHGSIGPSCSIGLYKESMLQIWSHSQGIYPLRESISKMIDIPEERIHITGMPGSGCYGHNGADDVSAEVAILAMANPGMPVRLQWSRADEHAWEPYGSAMIMDVKARLNNKGMIKDWKFDLWSDTHGTRPGGSPENLLPSRYIRKSTKEKPAGFSGGAYRNADPYYTIANQQVDMHFFDGPLRVSALRSLGAYGNIFAIESFMDELALKTGRDPFEFRIMHLQDKRAIAVLTRLKQMIERHGNKPGTGIAFSRYKNTASYCAVAVQAAIGKQGEIIIEKMFSVIDPGEAINTDGIINQTEGGMIQAASWTMQEEVQFDKDRILSRDWQSYPIFRFSQVPETFVEVINNPDEGPMGAGEAAQGPAGAAVANAVFRVTGKRYRDLPIVPMTKPNIS